MDLVGPEMSQGEIRVIYNDVYQLQRLPGRSPCDKLTAKQICQEILDSIKEHLWRSQLEEEPKWSPTGTSKMDAQAEFQARTHATYNHSKT